MNATRTTRLGSINLTELGYSRRSVFFLPLRETAFRSCTSLSRTRHWPLAVILMVAEGTRAKWRLQFLNVILISCGLYSTISVVNPCGLLKKGLTFSRAHTEKSATDFMYSDYDPLHRRPHSSPQNTTSWTFGY